MRSFASMMLYWLLPLTAHCWWCETSAVTGCVGHPRHFVLERSANTQFEAFETLPVDPTDQHLVVDWDKDGDLDIIKMTSSKGMDLYDQQDGQFVKIQPSPFKDVKAFACPPAVVDWNRDGHLDLLVATKSGVRYYERVAGGGLEKKTGNANPFQSIGGIHFCGHLSIADWDGDGDMDILIADLADSLLYFEQQPKGKFQFVEANPFLKIRDRIKFRKPLMVDWNNDGLMDLVLFQQPMRSYVGIMFTDIQIPDSSTCKVLVFLQDKAGNLSETSEPNGIFENKGCRYKDVFLTDVDGDHDFDAVFTTDFALHVYEHASDHSLSLPNQTQTTSFPVNKIRLSGHTTDPGRLNLTIPGMNAVADVMLLGGYRPYLADWDLDGDLDLALLSESPLFVDNVHPRFFEHHANHSVSELRGPNSSCPLNWSHPFSVTDFDGDGQLDVVGMRGTDFIDLEVLVCLQSSDGYVVMNQERNPFSRMYNLSSTRPTFLDWDADGDMDLIYQDTTDRLQWIEQLQDGTLRRPQSLPVPKTVDYVAADFDGDGDIDLVVTVPSQAGWKYYERREDGSLDEVLDNPFDDSLWRTVAPSTTSLNVEANTLYSALGDWNGDGAPDLVVLDGKRVSLLLNKPMRNFTEYTGGENPFSDIRIASPGLDTWNMVDVDGDGDLDFVYLPSGRMRMPTLEYMTAIHEGYMYFEQSRDGKLKQRKGVANPLQAAPKSLLNFSEFIASSKTGMQPLGMSHVVADVDGDGDVDIVHGYANANGFRYAEQRDGNFSILKGLGNPFDLGIVDRWSHTALDCWTLVDFDGDGALDIVRTIPGRGRGLDLLSSPGAFAIAAKEPRQVEYFEQGASLFFERYNSANNPFHSVNLSALPPKDSIGPYCPGVADVDNDGDLDLVLGKMSDGQAKFLYYEQQNGTFKLAVAENPFADIHLPNDGFLRFQLADWDGDGVVDLVASAGPSLHYFKQSQCLPSSSACDSSATCNKKTGKCVCSTGSRSPECRICSDYHTRQDSMCRSCPGFGTASGTCTRRGVCEDDADARSQQTAKNVTGFARDSATGAGMCNCSAPFYGNACEKGECPPGHRLERNAKVGHSTKKYVTWEACVPCQSGRFKKGSGNQECGLCELGLVPTANRSSCMPCPSGTTPHPNLSSCEPCTEGSVASFGASLCTPCGAGEAPNVERTQCERCAGGQRALMGSSAAGCFKTPGYVQGTVRCQVANPRSAQCTPCGIGAVPTLSRTSCIKCAGQEYALQGDEECRTCTFPAMILGIENWCTSLYLVLFLVSLLILALFVAALFGRFRLCCFKRRLRAMVEAKKWRELHATTTSRLEYGVWHKAAVAALEKQKEEVKDRSFQLGISLRFVFEELEAIYREKAREAEWRQDRFGPATRSSFLVRIRNAGEEVPDKEAAWNALQICPEPEDPNFHQVAGLLAYGPLALGKLQHCPRDGLPDCSIVDALEATSRSGRATWFLSWVWGYKFSTVSEALKRWWAQHERVSCDASDDIFIWWCVMVNNQFRMLEEGQTVDATDLFDVFGRQLAGIGKMLMCLDKMKEGSYTTRIWCIFEVFVACQRSIPTTVILPKLELDSIETLEELTKQCRVDAGSAQASVEEDAIMIKKRIMEDHESFDYVNQTVEKEVIKYMEAQGDEGATSVQLDTTNPSGVSEQSTDQTSSDKMLVVRPQQPQCHLQ